MSCVGRGSLDRGQAGLVTTEKIGRVRTCRIGPCRLEEEMEWIANYRRVWDARSTRWTGSSRH